jgi:hypothetical protein
VRRARGRGGGGRKKRLKGRLEAAHSDLLEAADALRAFTRGEDGEDAEVGSLLVAEFVLGVTMFLRGGKE